MTRPDYVTTRAATDRVLRAAEDYFKEYRQLTSRDANNPLNGLERFALEHCCIRLAEVSDLVAGMWDLHQPGLPIADGYREDARRFRCEAAVNEAMAEIAPRVPGIQW